MKDFDSESENENNPLNGYSTDELFKMRKDQQNGKKAKAAQYSTMLRKRSARSVRANIPEGDDIDSDSHYDSTSRRAFFRERAMSKRGKRQDLQDKVDSFLGHLNSKNDPDIEDNAQILADIIKSFSLTFNLTSQDIMKVINQEKDGLNVENIRQKLLALARG